MRFSLPSRVSLLLLLVAVTALAFAPAAQTQSLSIPSATSLSGVGAPLGVAVEFTAGTPMVNGFAFTVTFNSAAFNFVQVRQDGSTTNLTVNGSQTSPGVITVSGSGPDVIISGPVAVLDFTVATTSNPVPASTFSIGTATVNLAAGGTQPITGAPGTFSFAERADPNMDGLIDVVDVQTVVNFILSITPRVYPNHGDANGDLLVDVVDVQTVVNRILFGNPNVAVTTVSVPSAIVGVSYNFQFTAVGGNPPYTWTLHSGTLPGGITLSPSGVLSGTAGAASSGNITVRATDGNSATADGSYTFAVVPVSLTSISITPTPLSMDHNATQQLTATGTFNDSSSGNVTSQVHWTSSNTSVAVVGLTTGMVTAAFPGTSVITAFDPANQGVSSTVNVTVTKLYVSLTITPTNPNVVRLLTQAFVATANYSDASSEDVTVGTMWTSGTQAVATINTSAVATGLTVGSSVITGSRTIGGVNRQGTTTLTVVQESLTQITLTPNPASGAKGLTLQFNATGMYNNGTTSPGNINAQVTWSSGTTATATINSTGLATLANQGTSTITATSGAISGNASLTVTAPIVIGVHAITPTTPSINTSATQQFTAVGRLSDQTTTPNINSQVTWSSSNNGVATINSSGLATGVSGGTSTITATFNGGTPATANTVLTVNAPAMVSFATQIQPKIQMCQGCHAVAMHTYNGIRSYVSTPPVAANSVLYLRLAGGTAGTRMPQGGPFYEGGDLQLFADWINQGALNN